MILDIYSRDVGQRSAILSFSVGQGSQDIGFRNDIEVVFTAAPSHAVRLRIRDEHGQPTTAGFIIRDDRDRIYPNISKRLAPDFFFQPQVYRRDGDTVTLPAGTGRSAQGLRPRARSLPPANRGNDACQ